MNTNLDNLCLAPAETRKERQEVFHVRQLAYKKYFQTIDEAHDSFDDAKNSLLLLAKTVEGQPVGTIRILDRRTGAIELDNYVDLNSIFTHHAPVLGRNTNSCVEATRLSVPTHHMSSVIKIALYKAYYLYCWYTAAQFGIVWARRPAIREYRWLGFESLDPPARFRHPKLLNRVHEILVSRFCHQPEWQQRHPLYKVVCCERHPNIVVPKKISQ